MDFTRLRPKDETQLNFFIHLYLTGYGTRTEILEVVDKLCQLNYLQGQNEGIRSTNQSYQKALDVNRG